MDVQLADRSFDKAHFLKGARTAYEMIQNAFAKGDRGALRPLLSEDVFAAFDGAITARGSAPAEKLGGITDARIAGAGLEGNTAEVTVAFRAQFVDKDDKGQRDVSDLWTFARQVGASDPNWTLVATSGEAA
jgi:predicted lipid-binding transport protein (Tim44 family)